MKRTRPLISWSLYLFAAVVRAEPVDDYSRAFREPGTSKVLQFLNDPEVSGAAWMLTESLLQFNPQTEANGEWKIRFDADHFEKLTGTPAGIGYRHRKIQTSKRAGFLYLLLEADGPKKGTNYIFRTNDFGETWQYSKMGKDGPPSSVAQAPPKKAGKEVDLRGLANDTSPPTGAQAPASPPVSAAPDRTQPLFRVLFDLLLQIRPGANPWTFDNYHTLLLVEMFPKPELQFSFEVSPNPRYYELRYKISEALTIRGGRIWIPFDRMNPHNLFGGFVNTSLLRQPGTAAFLPDLWTDLGLGVDWRIVNSQGITLDFQTYAVNGFRDGGLDPAGEVGTRYPNFESAPGLDPNGDKALGFRLSTNVKGIFGFGLSTYSGRYTQQGAAPRRVSLVGVDGLLSPLPGTTLTAGYLYGHIGLLPGASRSHAVRGGAYVELSQRFLTRWRLTLRAGASQNDSRVQDPSDQTIVGGSLSYDLGLVRVGVQYFRDLLKVPNKTVKEYTALRAVALF